MADDRPTAASVTLFHVNFQAPLQHSNDNNGMAQMQVGFEKLCRTIQDDLG